jgi:RND family efflux transporter MFP subunit
MVSSIQVGESVDVRVSSLNNRTFSGKVARTSGKVDQATRTMITEVDVPNSSGLILPGMYAEVTLHLEHRNDVLSIPLEAIERSASGARVFRIDPQGGVHIVNVRLGVEDSRRAEILSGLTEGDPVAVAQRAGLREGEFVRIKTAGSGSAN